ncbi:MAG: histidine kinase [Pseudomonadota bacterium]|nr:histidine kinase [Pseudomonadota bacterium]
MSLRLRLSLLFLGLFILGMLSALGRSVDVAQTLIRSDIENARVLSREIIDLLAHTHDAGARTAAGTADFIAHLQELQQALNIDIEVQSRTRSYPEFTGHTPVEVFAPQWFVEVLNIDRTSLEQTLGVVDGDTITVRIDPGADINALWIDARDTLLQRTIGLLLFYLLSHVSIGIWLKTTQQIVDVLDDIVKGDFNRRVSHLTMPELDRIARKINHLVGVLGVSKSDNERLARQALTAKEQERRYFAQELHDSLGQAVSAIKAMAVSIAMRTRDTDAVTAESATRIEKISDTAYSSVRDLMSWLRPAILDELGLSHAVKHMVDEWNAHHDDTFCRLRLEGNVDDLKEEQKINVYRIVQEALTNAAKYADASYIDITLGGQEVLSLIIIDDGVGFDQDKVVLGMGLSGIRDRVNMLQGSLTISSRPGKGTSIHVEFPRVTGYRRRLSDRISY